MTMCTNLGAGGGGGGRAAKSSTPKTGVFALAKELPDDEKKDFYYRTAKQSYIDYLSSNDSTDALEEELKYNTVQVNLNLPTLTGSDKQIAWANDIRTKALNNQVESMKAMLKVNVSGQLANDFKDKAMNDFKKRGIKADSVSDMIQYAVENNANGAYSQLKKITSAKEIIDKRNNW